MWPCGNNNSEWNHFPWFLYSREQRKPRRFLGILFGEYRDSKKGYKAHPISFVIKSLYCLKKKESNDSGTMFLKDHIRHEGMLCHLVIRPKSSRGWKVEALLLRGIHCIPSNCFSPFHLIWCLTEWDYARFLIFYL